MTYLVNEKCIKCKYTDCVEVCPVDCFYEGENMLVINPDECIDCGVCEPECPVDAIIPDTDDKDEKWLEVNQKFYKKKETFTNQELIDFIKENEEELKVEYLNFDYAILNPQNLIGVNEFNQSFFDKIDQIEADIANGISFENIANNLDLPITKKIDFKLSSDSSEIEKKIYASKDNDFDILENNDDFILYKINEIYEKEPNLKDNKTKKCRKYSFRHKLRGSRRNS